MHVPELGELVEDPDSGWYRSHPVPVPILGDQACVFILDGYDLDPKPADFHAAIRTFRGLDRSVLVAAAPSIFAYYQDAKADDDVVVIDGPEDVLDHVTLGNEPMVSRDDYGDRHVYVSLECECAWEEEHGLQIVFRDGATVTKVGSYDGHLTNAAAYADASLEGVIYRGA